MLLPARCGGLVRLSLHRPRGVLSPPSSLLWQVRPLEVAFETWAFFRTQGIATPSIAAWQTVVPGTTLWQNVLDLYNNPAYTELVRALEWRHGFERMSVKTLRSRHDAFLRFTRML
jgi:hypothetical protein